MASGARRFSSLGLRLLLGETLARASADWVFDYLETEVGRLDAVFGPDDPDRDDEPRDLAEADFIAFDLVRRKAQFKPGRFRHHIWVKRWVKRQIHPRFNHFRDITDSLLNLTW